jgi:hypothetical protein
MAREKILHCKAMGAEVVLTRSDVGRGHADYYQDLAETITQRTPGALSSIRHQTATAADKPRHFPASDAPESRTGIDFPALRPHLSMTRRDTGRRAVFDGFRYPQGRRGNAIERETTRRR